MQNTKDWNAGWSNHFDKMAERDKQNPPTAKLETYTGMDGAPRYSVRVQYVGWALSETFKTLAEAEQYIKDRTI